MVEAAPEAIRLAEGSSQGDLKKDRTQSLAVVRLIEIVGEAASHVSDDCNGRLPDVPWQDNIGMRNRIVHAYFDINMDIAWLTVVKFLPDLVRALESTLSDWGEK